MESNRGMGSRYKGFASLDLLFSTIPILFIVLYLLIFVFVLETRTNERIEQQILFDKLVSISNYVVRVGAVKTEGSDFPNKKIYPNLIVNSDFSLFENKMKKRMHLKSLSINMDSEKGNGICIYRLVIFEDKIKKLYFCGE